MKNMDRNEAKDIARKELASGMSVVVETRNPKKMQRKRENIRAMSVKVNSTFSSIERVMNTITGTLVIHSIHCTVEFATLQSGCDHNYCY
jgi:hypothetical protein